MLKRCVMSGMAAMVMTVSSEGMAPPIDPARCRPAGERMTLAGLPEASGLTVSRATPGRLWSHNDSGRPVIFAIEPSGRVAGQVAITGVRVDDWEAMSSAPCGGGWCLYIADIGDNNAKRKQVTVYRVPEPAQPSGSATADAVIQLSYPDGAHDAEDRGTSHQRNPSIAGRHAQPQG